MKETVRICLDLPADARFVQIFDEYSGRVVATTIEADINLGEINMGLAEFENALREMAWVENDEKKRFS